MKVQFKIKWMMLFPLLLVSAVFFMDGNSEAQRGKVGTQTCINCHQNWFDNDPSVEDVLSPVSVDYFPC